MNQISDFDINSDYLRSVTFEQLYDCAAILALSIVHYRGKFGVIPFRFSPEELIAARNGSVSTSMLAEGRKILEEAFALIQGDPELVTNEISDGKATRIKLEEKRQQRRINVMAPIRVKPDNSPDLLAARLVNISWGGATLHTEHTIGEVGDFIVIELPPFKNSRIRVQAEILRNTMVFGERTYGVRFSKVRTDDEAILEQLLAFLASSGKDSGQREDTRLTQRIDIQYDDTNELNATLEDISAGGLGITVPEPMELNQSLQVAISTTDDRCELVLRARVVRQHALEYSNIRMYRVGLEFEHPSEDIKSRVSNIIQNLASINLSDKMSLQL